MTINVRTSLAGLIAAIVALAATNAQAILVYNTNNSGAGSLRQAITDSNAGGGNTIIFSNVVTGTITLSSQLGISANVTIMGPGANVLTVSGNNASRVFSCSNATVVISGLTIANGNVTFGGGILNHGTLTLSNCIVSGNTSDFGGGGIFNHSTLTLSNCTVSGNSVASGEGGGGIHSVGDLILLNCTVSGNQNSGGGGGGIFVKSSTLNLFNSTVVSNTADTGGGVYNSNGGITVRSSIIASNSATFFGGPDVFGAVTSQGYNLIGNTTNSTGFGAVGDQLNVPANFGPLQDNGGSTPTMMPLAGSLAIDQGKSFGLATDQRGRVRPFDNPAIPPATLGDNSDIGAVEVYPAVTSVVSNTNDSGVSSLRQVIVDAAPIDTITFASGVSGTIALTSGELLIGKNVTILGPTAAGVTVSGNNASRVFRLTAGTTTISSLTIANGNTGGPGSGFFSQTGSTLVLSNCSVTGNVSGDSGGGVANNGTVTAVNCTFYGNRANNGGGLYNFAGTLNLFNSTVVSNSATVACGGVWNFFRINPPLSTATIRSSIIASNSPSSSPDVKDTFISQGYNLIANTTGSSGFTAATDQTGVDPLLGPLADNGGPTKTMALRVGSPAIDKGNSFGLTADQRGQPRYDNPNIAPASGGDDADIGAYEATELRIVNAQKTGNHLRLDFINWLGTNYEVQSRSDLTTGAWGSLAGTTPGNGGIASTTVSNVFGVPKQFYRIHPVL